MEHVPYTMGGGVGNQSVKLSSVLLALIKQMKPIKVKQNSVILIANSFHYFTNL